MMHPSLPPAAPDRPPCSSVFDAIRDSDWEGLLTLYATTAYDAVHSAEFARRGGGLDGGFHDEKKMEAALSFRQGFHNKKSSSSPAANPPYSSSSSAVRELVAVVREIIGAEIFDEHHAGTAGCGGGSDDLLHDKAQASHHPCGEDRDRSDSKPSSSSRQVHATNQHTNKKTRLHHRRSPSPSSSPPRLPSPRRAPPGGLTSALDHILFHGHAHPSSALDGSNGGGRRGGGERTDWEAIMWDSAAVLSNGRPSPDFVVHRRDRDRRERELGKDSEGDDSKRGGEEEGEDDEKERAAPIFEGSVANATPADHHPVLNGTQQLLDPHTLAPAARPLPGGSGTAQHLACLLDAPLALAFLICLGVDCAARHTAFRRLAVHEAACADSPLCLGLLMEVGAGAWDRGAPTTAEVVDAGVEGYDDGLKWLSAHTFYSPVPSAAASTSSGTDPLELSGRSFSSEMEGRTGHHQAGRKPSKKKINLFSGWNKGGKAPVGGTGGMSSISKKPPPEAERPPRERKSPPPQSAPPERASFPTALRVMWEAVRMVRSGLMDEADAAHHVLDRVGVPDGALAALAMQCPPPDAERPNGGASASAAFPPSALASIPGLSSAVHQLFQQPQNPRSNHGRDRPAPPPRRTNVDGHGNTPLHWAAFKNAVRAVDVLLTHHRRPDGPGASDFASRVVNVRAQPSGWTPLHDAAYSDAADAVTRLIAAGADVDARSHSGATPLCFAAQEDAPNATRRLLEAGADPAVRCLGNSPGSYVRANNADQAGQFHSRFSGYTPLHYCAHYNAARAARVLLEHRSVHRNHASRNGRGGRDRSLSHPLPHGYGVDLLEIPDLNDKLPIHVAAARGSSRVLRELLHGGARVETRASICHFPSTPPRPRARSVAMPQAVALAATARRSDGLAAAANDDEDGAEDTSASPGAASAARHRAPVPSPVLRAMIPSQPIQSSKPWNCLSQKSIDACRHLIEEAERSWAPGRHGLFAPADRAAVLEVLRVGKRLERMGISAGLMGTVVEGGPGRGIFLDLWPRVLSFCGRGWFEPDDAAASDQEGEEEETKASAEARKNDDGQGRGGGDENEEEISIGSTSFREDDGTEKEFTQFQLDEASDSMAAIL